MVELKKILNSKLKYKSGTSPIIAAILLIGLTVVSGAILYGVTLTFLQAQPPLSLNYETPTVFKSTETSFGQVNSLIDTFDMQISNPNNQQMIVDLASAHVYNASNGNTEIKGWYIDSNNTMLLMNGLESTTVTFKTNTNTINSTELSAGTQIYASFTVERIDGSNPTVINTSKFTVSAAQFDPNFIFVQDTTTVYFNANATQSITQDISGVLWNFGNPTQSYTKTVNLFLTNNTLFTPDTTTQIVTIPSSTVIGDNNNPGPCLVGEACVNIAFSVTKNAIKNTNTTYGAIISISGVSDLATYDLEVRPPTIAITLENTNRFNWGNWGFGGNRQSCTSFPNWNNNNQIYNTITFNGAPSCADTKTVKFDVWNLQNFPSNATLAIIGLNTTAFTLYTNANSSTNWRFNNRNAYDSEPYFMVLPKGPGQTFRWFNYCANPQYQACNTTSWGISRNVLVDKNGDLVGIEAGDYPVTIMDLRTGISISVNLYIAPYVKVVHVASLTGSYSKNSRTLTFTVTVEDDTGATVNRVVVIANYSYPQGGSGKTRTDSVSLNIYFNGVGTFTDFNPAKGKHTFTVTDIQSQLVGRNRWNRQPALIIIYDSSANTPNPPTVSVTV